MNPFDLYADEGYNLIKGLFWSYGLSHETAWSDQPSLLAALLGFLFSTLGTSQTVARLLVASFSLILLISLCLLWPKNQNTLVSVIGMLLLLAAPWFLLQSIAVIIALPSVALALASVAVLRRAALPAIVISGLLWACALQTKLDTVLLLPALLVTLWQMSLKLNANKEGLSDTERTPQRDVPTFGRLLFWWLGSAAVVFLFIAWALGFDPQMLIGTHLGKATREAFAGQAGAEAMWKFALEDYTCVLLALVGIGFVFGQRRWDCLFPVVWLATEILARLWHRPFWPFHWLHLAVPLAWLAGIGVQGMWDKLKSYEWAAFRRPPYKGLAVLAVFSLLISLALVEMPGKIQRELARFPQGDDSGNWRVVDKMKEYKGQTRWVFADSAIFPFHAGLLVPPEIAVLSNKRLKAGLITQADLLEILKRYRPEQALERRGVFGGTIQEWFRRDYTLIMQEGAVKLYVRNDLVKPGDKPRNETDELGLPKG